MQLTTTTMISTTMPVSLLLIRVIFTVALPLDLNGFMKKVLSVLCDLFPGDDTAEAESFGTYFVHFE